MGGGGGGRWGIQWGVPKHREDNIQKYPRNFMRRMDYPEFYPARMDI
jgi:hypothetical protein